MDTGLGVGDGAGVGVPEGLAVGEGGEAGSASKSVESTVGETRISVGGVEVCAGEQAPSKMVESNVASRQKRIFILRV